MAGTNDAKFHDLCERFWKWRLQDSPEFATFCGFHEFDDKMDDLSIPFYSSKLGIMKQFLNEAKQIDSATLSKSAKLDLFIFIEDLECVINGFEFESYYFPINFLEGPHLSMNLQIGWMKFKTETDYLKYVKRMQSFAKQLKSVKEILKEAIGKGYVSSIESVKEVPEQLQKLIKESTEKTGDFYKPFKETPKQVSLEKLHDLEDQLTDVLCKELVPALESLKDFLVNTYMKNVRQKPGICNLPNGEKFYQACIKFHTSYDVTPQEIHDLGLKEVARIKGNMIKIFQEEGLPPNIAEASKILFERKDLCCNTAEELLEFVKDICFNKIQPLLPKLFKDLPAIPLKISEAPSIMTSSPPAFYLAGTPDGSRSGTYYINLTKVDACPKYEIPALSLHEGEPGHHTQASSAMITKSPNFRCYMEDMKYYLTPSRFPMHTAYVEGWGLYCESLGEELGLYPDNFQKLGRYNFEIHRACRLVIDTGIHSFGWSAEDAFTYMTENCPMDPWFIRNEINRYITWPGQALGYKYGEIKLWEFRRKAQNELGVLFDVREFHKVVLNAGAMPLNLLEKLVDDYISETKTAAQKE